MATTIPASNINNLKSSTNSTRRNSSAREPKAVRSILRSANGPPGLHARDSHIPGESSVSPPGSSDAHDGPASSELEPQSQPNAHAQPQPQSQADAEAEAANPHAPSLTSDGRPPSIHLSEDPPLSLASVPDAMPRPPPVNVSVPRARRPTLDLPAPPSLDLYSTDHKLALESTSPKPCIVPGNALHLIDDDPAAPRSATPPSVIIVGDESEHGAEPESDGEFDVDVDGLGEGDGDGDGERGGEGDGAGVGVGVGMRRSASQPPGAAGTGNGTANGSVHPAPRVRFRSRVRITSGVHRHRHSVSATGGSTPGSTTSDSPSSSISAPLRYQADENAAWGPIGKRLSAYAGGGSWQRRTQPQVQVQRYDGQANGVRGGAVRGRAGVRGGRAYGERTPLLRPPVGVHSEDEDDEDSQGMSEEERTMRASALRREEEAVFGKWPWRIFNRHWWWWHVEPIFCCCADDEYEDF